MMDFEQNLTEYRNTSNEILGAVGAVGGWRVYTLRTAALRPVQADRCRGRGSAVCRDACTCLFPCIGIF